MKRIELTPILAAAVLTVVSNVEPVHARNANQLTPFERQGGWRLLFDGQTTQGWRNYRSDSISTGWTVSDGELSCSNGGGDIVTLDMFDNFEMSIEYKISKGGNSGILFHVREDGTKAWHSGPEIQLLDNDHHRATQKSGWLYQLYNPVVPAWSLRARAEAGVGAPVTVDATRPAGQWNQLYLRVTEDESEVVLNGVGYYRFQIGSDDWNQRVANSKFAKFPRFGKSNGGHICLQDHGDEISFRNIKLRSLSPNGEVEGSSADGELRLEGKLAFPHLQWKDWQPIDDDGRLRPLRFMELTHAADNRIFVADQGGIVYVFDNDPDVKQSDIFLDLSTRCADWKSNNEEGLLGLALHPQFKKNGHFFVYYSPADDSRTSVLSRFVVSREDPNRADPDSEQVLMRFSQPFRNHNGGSIAFGPDGYLYIGLGDGGDRNDPFGHGQNLSTWMGSILRIDVDRQQADKAYGIPDDNPFIDVPQARPEIFAHGVRNIWRLAFDRESGDLWAADVGQDLWEEINIVRRGGNYGWNIREGTHLFGNAEQGDVSEPIDPIWEYDHRIGKSITGGRVYRGTRLHELVGMYLYADYVTGRIWALDYDREAKSVRQNLSIAAGGIPVLAFGEDATGEVYYVTAAANGKCIYRFERK